MLDCESFTKKIVQKTLCLFTCLLMFCSVSQAESINIRFSHIATADTPKGQMALKFQSLVKQRLGDEKVVVKIYPNSTLYADSEAIDEILKNNVEMAAPSMSNMRKISPRLQVLDLPFLFVTPEAANNFLQGPYGDRLLRTVESSGLLGLGFLNDGMKQLSTREPAIVPEDFEGMKFRIVNSEVLKVQFGQLKASSFVEPFNQVYDLLRTKEMDGQENTWSNIYSKKFHEVQPSIVESNHGYLGYMVLTNKKFWNGIPKDIREVLDVSLAEAIVLGNKVALAKSVEDKNKIIASGVSNIHSLTIDERKEWVIAMKPVWAKFEDEIGTELVLSAASSR